MQWLQSLFSMSNAVARISDTTTGEPFGTGFLIKGKYISNDLIGKTLLVTNSHVISDQGIDKAPLATDEATAEFTTLPNRPKIEIGEQVFYSPRTELDISIHQIDAPSDSLVLKPKTHMPIIPNENDAPMRIFVIGHPLGGEISVTLYGNELKKIDLPYFQYKSPTEGGSSGSPVFNRGLKLIGLHHAAKPADELNEGISFGSILNEVNS